MQDAWSGHGAYPKHSVRGPSLDVRSFENVSSNSSSDMKHGDL